MKTQTNGSRIDYLQTLREQISGESSRGTFAKSCLAIPDVVGDLDDKIAELKREELT